jgi:hypothetical protein
MHNLTHYLAVLSGALIATMAMLPTCASGSAGQETRQESLFQKYFPRPSGRNGMEEYLAAADMVAASDYGKLGVWEGYRMRVAQAGPQVEHNPEFVEITRTLGDPWKTTVLAARRKAVAGLARVRSLVIAGNNKPIWSLHEKIGPDTLFPELGRLKTVVKLLATEAFVHFADGNSALGTDVLLAALTMNHRLPQDTILARLVTIACNAIILAEFERHLARMSTRDVAKVLAVLSELPKWESRVLEAVSGEGRQIEVAVNQLKEQGPKWIEDWGLEEAEPFLKSLSPDQWSKLCSDVQVITALEVKRAEEILAGPESQWFRAFKAQGITEESGSGLRPSSVLDAVRVIASTLTGLWPTVAESEARMRTQLRLLRLHLRVHAYNWAEGRLPERLEQAAPAEQFADNFGGGQFEYRPDRFGHYELFSKGFAHFGRVDLRWRRDPAARIVPRDDDPPKE